MNGFIITMLSGLYNFLSNYKVNINLNQFIHTSHSHEYAGTYLFTDVMSEFESFQQLFSVINSLND